MAAVAGRRPARIGLTTAIAGIALVSLLAVGFGAFGGRARPTATPGNAVAAGPSATETTSLPTTLPIPRVTPFTTCAPEGGDVPPVFLAVDEIRYSGALEILSVEAGHPTPDLPEEQDGQPASVEIPMGAATSLQIADWRCALAWVIDLDGGSTSIEVLANGAMDPERAAQNRFELALGDNPGRQSLLRAQLLFPGFSYRASWTVSVDGVGHPAAEVQWQDGQVSEAVEGCFVSIHFPSGWQELPGDCLERELPKGTRKVGLKEAFRFSLTGWTVSVGGVTCGKGVNDGFAPDDAGCGWSTDDAGGIVTIDFPATFANDTWTLAIDGCAVDGPFPGAELCGTWYTRVEVR